MSARHVPSDETRKSVQAMAAVGIPQTDMAKVLQISVKTLCQHYASELDTGLVKANTNVGGALYGAAVGGNVTAMIFWLKTRAGWKERIGVDLTEIELKEDDELIAEAEAALSRIKSQRPKPPSKS